MNKIVQIQRMEAWLQKSPARRKVLACLDWYMAKRAQHLSRYHTESQSAYRIKSWLVATVIVLIGLAALAGAAKVGQHHYRHHAEKRSLEQTRLFLERGDYRNAALSAQQTLILNPKNLSACRVQAELAERNHSPPDAVLAPADRADRAHCGKQIDSRLGRVAIPAGSVPARGPNHG